MVTGPAQLLHGLRLSGDVTVPGAANAEGPADFEVRLSPPEAVPDVPPDGEGVAALPGPGAGYAAALRDETLTVRFFETAEFEVDLAGGTIAARPAPGRGEAMVPVLLAGNVLALDTRPAGRVRAPRERRRAGRLVRRLRRAAREPASRRPRRSSVPPAERWSATTRRGSRRTVTGSPCTVVLRSFACAHRQRPSPSVWTGRGGRPGTSASGVEVRAARRTRRGWGRSSSPGGRVARAKLP